MASLVPGGRRPSRSPFDPIRHVEEDSQGKEFEYWSAREAMEPLGYKNWQNMENVIRKARTACRNSGHDPDANFIDVSKHQAGSRVPFRDVQMTRFGMYLLAMNGDPDKSEIAHAQRYFAVQTYRAEQLLPPPSPPVATPPPASPIHIGRPWADRFRQTFMPHVRDLYQRHPGCFSVVSAAVSEIIMIEDELIRHLMTTRGFDRPDISIGMRYATHRRGRGCPEPTRWACLYLPQQQLSVDVRVYPGDEYGDFSTWFRGTYLPDNLPEYLNGKPELRMYERLTRASAADNACVNLTGRPASLPPRVRASLNAAGGFAPARQLPGGPGPRQLPPA